MLGEPVTSEYVTEILTGFGLEKVGGLTDDEEVEAEETEWVVPSYRHDLRREVDLIEEIVRVHGLDRVEGRIGGWVAPSSAVDRDYDFQMGLKRRLAGMGFAEVRNGSLVSLEAGVGGAPLKNPLNEENAVLRNTLLPGLLAAAGRNARQGTTDLLLFESGRVFAPGISPGTPEPGKLALLITGALQPHSWRHGSDVRLADLHDLRGVLERLLAPSAVEFRPMEPPLGSPVVLAADLLVDGREVGGVAQMSPEWRKELGLRGEVFVADLRLRELAAVQSTPNAFQPLARFPSVTRDLAVVVDRLWNHGRIAGALRGANEPLLASVELFDVFTDDRGEKIAADKKSLAYSLTYRAEDRTLRAEEVNAAHARLKGALQAGFGGLQFRE